MTGLALVVIDAPRDAFRGGRHIGVLHDHLWAFSPALESDPLEIRLTGVAQHQLADFGRAREAHHVDIAVQGESLARLFAEAGDDVEHSGRQPRLQRELTQANRGQRGLLGRLQHDRVAGQQRRRELPRTDDERVVPGNDGRDDSERLAANERQVIGSGRGNLVVELVGELGIVGNTVGGKRYIDSERVADRLADIERLQRREALQVRSHQLREAQQNALALLGLRAPPDTALEGGARRGHGRLHVSGLTTRDLGNDATIYRADVLERATRVGCHQLAVDESAAFGPQSARDLHPFRAASGRNTRVHGVSAP